MIKDEMRCLTKIVREMLGIRMGGDDVDASSLRR